MKPPPSPPHTKPTPVSLGFTLMEVIVVIILLGILAVVAVVRFSGTDAEDVAAANTLKTHLRYAQIRAMADVVYWGIEIETSNKYVLIRETGGVPNLPGESEPYLENIPANISPLTTFRFSPGRGQPIDSGGNVMGNDQTISVGTQAITITQETGFIP
ncbi:prepilin-type N-terminal cleavage/methylation domain-containing protein [Desulfonatronum lacustre]|uniref:prepilin-type N-terminal cleavage/methylation domain-containing protein n=1 Tax=Desulfonatronum lacustre TaxID=66849 RepID=UPI00068417B9|nr:prepilin-type N-terminal cleavage/methylation domain-containing protein [Desulfonatronum lacustre]